MPTYSYKCDQGHEQNETHGMLEDPEIVCWQCKARNVMRRSIKVAQFSFRHGMRGDMRDYREDLARFKGDPRAFVDGPRSLQKLIDQTKREGADIRPLDEAGVGAPPSVEDEEDENDEMFREAQAEAIQELAEEN